MIPDRKHIKHDYLKLLQEFMPTNLKKKANSYTKGNVIDIRNLMDFFMSEGQMGKVLPLELTPILRSFAEYYFYDKTRELMKSLSKNQKQEFVRELGILARRIIFANNFAEELPEITEGIEHTFSNPSFDVANSWQNIARFNVCLMTKDDITAQIANIAAQRTEFSSLAKTLSLNDLEEFLNKHSKLVNQCKDTLIDIEAALIITQEFIEGISSTIKQLQINQSDLRVMLAKETQAGVKKKYQDALSFINNLLLYYKNDNAKTGILYDAEKTVAELTQKKEETLQHKEALDVTVLNFIGNSLLGNFANSISSCTDIGQLIAWKEQYNILSKELPRKISAIAAMSETYPIVRECLSELQAEIQNAGRVLEAIDSRIEELNKQEKLPPKTAIKEPEKPAAVEPQDAKEFKQQPHLEALYKAIDERCLAMQKDSMLYFSSVIEIDKVFAEARTLLKEFLVGADNALWVQYLAKVADVRKVQAEVLNSPSEKQRFYYEAAAYYYNAYESGQKISYNQEMLQKLKENAISCYKLSNEVVEINNPDDNEIWSRLSAASQAEFSDVEKLQAGFLELRTKALMQLQQFSQGVEKLKDKKFGDLLTKCAEALKKISLPLTVSSVDSKADYRALIAAIKGLPYDFVEVLTMTKQLLKSEDEVVRNNAALLRDFIKWFEKEIYNESTLLLPENERVVAKRPAAVSEQVKAVYSPDKILSVDFANEAYGKIKSFFKDNKEFASEIDGLKQILFVQRAPLTQKREDIQSYIIDLNFTKQEELEFIKDLFASQNLLLEEKEALISRVKRTTLAKTFDTDEKMKDINASIEAADRVVANLSILLEKAPSEVREQIVTYIKETADVVQEYASILGVQVPGNISKYFKEGVVETIVAETVVEKPQSIITEAVSAELQPALASAESVEPPHPESEPENIAEAPVEEVKEKEVKEAASLEELKQNFEHSCAAYRSTIYAALMKLQQLHDNKSIPELQKRFSEISKWQVTLLFQVEKNYRDYKRLLTLGSKEWEAASRTHEQFVTLYNENERKLVRFRSLMPGTIGLAEARELSSEALQKNFEDSRKEYGNTFDEKFAELQQLIADKSVDQALKKVDEILRWQGSQSQLLINDLIAWKNFLLPGSIERGNAEQAMEEVNSLFHKHVLQLQNAAESFKLPHDINEPRSVSTAVEQYVDIDASLSDLSDYLSEEDKQAYKPAANAEQEEADITVTLPEVTEALTEEVILAPEVSKELIIEDARKALKALAQHYKNYNQDLPKYDDINEFGKAALLVTNYVNSAHHGKASADTLTEDLSDLLSNCHNELKAVVDIMCSQILSNKSIASDAALRKEIYEFHYKFEAAEEAVAQIQPDGSIEGQTWMFDAPLTMTEVNRILTNLLPMEFGESNVAIKSAALQSILKIFESEKGKYVGMRLRDVCDDLISKCRNAHILEDTAQGYADIRGAFRVMAQERNYYVTTSVFMSIAEVVQLSIDKEINKRINELDLDITNTSKAYDDYMPVKVRALKDDIARSGFTAELKEQAEGLLLENEQNMEAVGSPFKDLERYIKLQKNPSDREQAEQKKNQQLKEITLKMGEQSRELLDLKKRIDLIPVTKKAIDEIAGFFNKKPTNFDNLINILQNAPLAAWDQLLSQDTKEINTFLDAMTLSAIANIKGEISEEKLADDINSVWTKLQSSILSEMREANKVSCNIFLGTLISTNKLKQYRQNSPLMYLLRKVEYLAKKENQLKELQSSAIIDQKEFAENVKLLLGEVQYYSGNLTTTFAKMSEDDKAQLEIILQQLQKNKQLAILADLKEPLLVNVLQLLGDRSKTLEKYISSMVDFGKERPNAEAIIPPPKEESKIKETVVAPEEIPLAVAIKEPFKTEEPQPERIASALSKGEIEEVVAKADVPIAALREPSPEVKEEVKSKLREQRGGKAALQAAKPAFKVRNLLPSISGERRTAAAALPSSNGSLTNSVGAVPVTVDADKTQKSSSGKAIKFATLIGTAVTIVTAALAAPIVAAVAVGSAILGAFTVHAITKPSDKPKVTSDEAILSRLNSKPIAESAMKPATGSAPTSAVEAVEKKAASEKLLEKRMSPPKDVRAVHNPAVTNVVEVSYDSSASSEYKHLYTLNGRIATLDEAIRQTAHDENIEIRMTEDKSMKLYTLYKDGRRLTQEERADFMSKVCLSLHSDFNCAIKFAAQAKPELEAVQEKFEYEKKELLEAYRQSTSLTP